MYRSIIVKSMINGITSYLAFALVLVLARGMALEQAIAAPATIALGIAAVAGSSIGFALKAAE